MCEVRQKNINFTTFVVCTTRGWSTIQSLYECSSILYFISNSTLKAQIDLLRYVILVFGFCFFISISDQRYEGSNRQTRQKRFLDFILNGLKAIGCFFIGCHSHPRKSINHFRTVIHFLYMIMNFGICYRRQYSTIYGSSLYAGHFEKC